MYATEKFMSVRDARREAAIHRMADYILSDGLSAATLRTLAAAAGTSDRMLLYYFRDKDELLTATLEEIAKRMLVQLDDAVSLEPARSPGDLLDLIWAAMASQGLISFMHVWLDLASGAARGLQPHRDFAGQLADGFLAWVIARLEQDPDGAPSHMAPTLVAAIEGMLFLTSIGRGALADSARNELVARLRQKALAEDFVTPS